MRGNRVWAEINLSAVRHNVKLLRRHLAEETRLLAVVKADGYGHGALPFAWTAVEAGAEMLGVGDSNEAIELREGGITHPILILHGDCDAHVPPGQSRLLFEALSAKGAEATLTQIGGLGHGFLNRNDLDDGGPRDVVVTTCDSPGEALRDKRLIWEEIHAFLKRSLR